MLPFAMLPPASKLQVQTILQFSIAIVLEVIASRKLQHVLRSNKHEAFQKEKYKLDLIEQPYLDKTHFR